MIEDKVRILMVVSYSSAWHIIQGIRWCLWLFVWCKKCLPYNVAFLLKNSLKIIDIFYISKEPITTIIDSIPHKRRCWNVIKPKMHIGKMECPSFRLLDSWTIKEPSFCDYSSAMHFFEKTFFATCQYFLSMLQK